MTPLYPYYQYSNVYMDFVYDKKLNVYVRMIDYKTENRRELILSNLEEYPKNDYGKTIGRHVKLALEKAKFFMSLESLEYFTDIEREILAYIKNSKVLFIGDLKESFKLGTSEITAILRPLSAYRFIEFKPPLIKYINDRKPFSFSEKFKD